jgi:sialidase-1
MHLVPLLLAALVAVPEPTEQVLFAAGKDGYHTYRIPALAVTSKGSVLAFCEGRKTSASDRGDIDLMYKRSTDAGVTWSPMMLLHEEGGDAKIVIGNPCVVVDGDAVILVFTRNAHDVFVTRSEDDGKTWAKPREITKDVFGKDWTWFVAGPGNGIVLKRGPHAGRLVMPCDHRVKVLKDRGPALHSHAIYSDDHGRTWKSGAATDSHMNECAVVERADGSLLMNMRSYRGKGQRATTVSTDAGETWGPSVDEPALPDPVCEGSIIRYSDKTLLFSNAADARKRVNLTLRRSDDDGKTWPIATTICAGPAAYSALARLADGTILLCYERGPYREIVLVRIDPKWLR